MSTKKHPVINICRSYRINFNTSIQKYLSKTTADTQDRPLVPGRQIIFTKNPAMSTSSPERVFEVEMNNFPPPPAVNVESDNPPPQQLVFDIVGVEEGRINSNLETAMNTIAISTRPENTTKAYAKKQNKWQLFCEHAYPYDDAKFCYTVKEERCYCFILFQCFCSRQKCGGQNGGNNSAPVFDSEEYDEVIHKYQSGGHIPFDAELDGISNYTLVQYRAIVKEEHDMQAARSAAEMAKYFGH